MASLVDIERNFAIWVQRTNPSENGNILDGLVFDGEFGFGTDAERGFDGQVLMLSESGQQLATAVIDTIHIAHRGTFWYTDMADLPNTPFLVTSDLQLAGPYVTSTFIPSTEAKSILGDADGAALPFVSERAIGVIEQRDAIPWLTFFCHPQRPPHNDEELFFAEWDAPAGVFSGKLTA